ncbi:MAG TPA: aminotransferase class V-fold PLP-dependent enzyme, partial [Gemmataceae bacterium]
SRQQAAGSKAEEASLLPAACCLLPAVHTDAAQAVGKIAVNFRALQVTALTVSGHKFGGPPGVGALLLRRGANLRPLFYGGHQQHGRRPGTEPVALAVGLTAALAVAVRDLDANTAHVRRLRERFLARLRSDAAPVVVNGDGVPHILNVSFPGCAADGLLMALDLAGVACSAGSACSSGSLLPSPVLRAMGLPDAELRSAVRFSFGPHTTGAEADDAAGRVVATVKRLRSLAAD